MSADLDPGRVRLELGQAQGGAASVKVSSDRPRLADGLRGRNADEAVRLVPLLFALCGKAQGRAATLALNAARGGTAGPRLDAAAQAEALREHLWRWLLDLPPLLGREALKTDFAEAHAMLARGDRAGVRRVLEGPVIAGLVDALSSAVDIEVDEPVCLPSVDAAASLTLFSRLDASFCRAPHLQGRACETGALARRREGRGSGAFARRWLARLDEVADWAQTREKVGACGTASSATVAPGVGRGLVETARGLLMHEIVLDGDRVADYFIVAPTEWNFHAQGPLARWLAGRHASSRESLADLAMRAVAALDPCVDWELVWS